MVPGSGSSRWAAMTPAGEQASAARLWRRHDVRLMQVTALNVYPVKSCAGTALEEATLDRRGIVHDREFMLVDANRRFITQREQPRLALVKPIRTESALT